MAEESDVVAVLGAYQEAVNHRDVERYVGLFDEDVVWALPGRPPVRDRNGIREAMESQFSAAAPPGFRFELTPEVVDIAGDTAVVVTHPEATVSSDGAATRQVADLTAIFVLRSREGHWRIARQVVNSRI